MFGVVMVKVVHTVYASSSTMGTKISPNVTTNAHPSVHYAGMRPITGQDATMKTSQENLLTLTAELSQQTT